MTEPTLRDRLANKLAHTLSRMGVSVARRSNTLSGARRSLLTSGRITLLVDGGAHDGEFALQQRREGYLGAVISIEPQPDHFHKLLDAANEDPEWDCVEAALGSRTGNASLNLSGNDGFSSSLLPMAEAHEIALPVSKYISTVEVPVTTLDSVASPAINAETRVYLKLDLQGNELDALKGGSSLVSQCDAVELELSLLPLYRGQPLIGDLIAELAVLGFGLSHIEPEFRDPSSQQLLQVNGLFQRYLNGSRNRESW